MSAGALQVIDRKAESVYHDVTSFLDACDTSSLARRDRYSSGLGRSWAGDGDYADCRRLALTGWDQEVAPTEHIAGRVIDRVWSERTLAPSVTTRYDVSGGSVDIDRYLTGEPECLLELIPRQVAQAGRAVRLVIHNGVRATVSPETYRRRGAAVVALIDALRQADDPLEIWAGSDATFQTGQPRWSYLVQIQAACDPLDIGRVIFFASHPGAHRQLGFAVRTSKDHPGHGDHVGGSHPLGPSCVPDDHTGTTIVLPQLHDDRSWSEAECAAWVGEQLDLIFGR